MSGEDNPHPRQPSRRQSLPRSFDDLIAGLDLAANAYLHIVDQQPYRRPATP
jgi:hypothetical protein